MRDPACEEALRVAAERLEPVLGPIGFQFAPDHTSESHGAFANGFFVKDDLKIGLIYRDSAKFGGVSYENSRAVMSHKQMMGFLGLRRTWRLDPIAALVADLSRVSATLQDRAAMDAMFERARKERIAEWRIQETPVGGEPATPPTQTETPAPTPTPTRRLGHVLLLIAAILFTIEAVVFLADALHEGLTPAGLRALILTITVFLTTAAALTGFIRRIRLPIALLIGLLLLQPGAMFVTAAVGHVATEVSLGEAVIFAVLGAALIVRVVIVNRR